MLTSSSSIHTAPWPLVLSCTLQCWPPALLFTLQVDLCFFSAHFMLTSSTVHVDLKLLYSHCKLTSFSAHSTLASSSYRHIAWPPLCCIIVLLNSDIYCANIKLLQFCTRNVHTSTTPNPLFWGHFDSPFLGPAFLCIHSETWFSFLSTHATQTSIFRLFPSFCLLMQSLLWPLHTSTWAGIFKHSYGD